MASQLQLSVHDANGLPLPGARAVLTVTTPEGSEVLVRTLPTGQGDLTYLELPPYYGGFLPDGSPLPACDPANDYLVTVELLVRWVGHNSAERVAFDNCAFLLAMAGATGSHALAYTFTVPEVGSVLLPGIGVNFGP
jgi:hypothetical protein